MQLAGKMDQSRIAISWPRFQVMQIHKAWIRGPTSVQALTFVYFSRLQCLVSAFAAEHHSFVAATFTDVSFVAAASKLIIPNEDSKRSPDKGLLIPKYDDRNGSL